MPKKQRAGSRVSDEAHGKHLYRERWLDIAAALEVIARERDVGPKTAEKILVESSASGKVRSRHIFGDPYKKQIVYRAMRPATWRQDVVLGYIDLAKGTYCQFDQPDSAVGRIEINADALSKWLERSHRGPKPGTVTRYAASDRELFALVSG
jgi:hypothetical protein